jgi:coenzyme Q-binding protein COQ10
MPAHSETQFLPYTPRQMFDLVADVARYPEFLPWCRAARVLERKDREFLGELVIAFAHFTESYTSRVILMPPADENAVCGIEVVMVKGPFEHLTNSWKFSPHEGGCRIDFTLDFKFRSFLLESLMGGLFTRATAKMVDAFRSRAEALYGAAKP